MASVSIYIDKEDFDKQSKIAEKRWKQIMDDGSEGYLFKIETEDPEITVEETRLLLSYYAQNGISIDLDQGFDASILSSLAEILINKYEKAQELFKAIP